MREHCQQQTLTGATYLLVFPMREHCQQSTLTGAAALTACKGRLIGKWQQHVQDLRADLFLRQKLSRVLLEMVKIAI